MLLLAAAGCWMASGWLAAAASGAASGAGCSWWLLVADCPWLLVGCLSPLAAAPGWLLAAGWLPLLLPLLGWLLTSCWLGGHCWVAGCRLLFVHHLVHCLLPATCWLLPAVLFVVNCPVHCLLPAICCLLMVAGCCLLPRSAQPTPGTRNINNMSCTLRPL